MVREVIPFINKIKPDSETEDFGAMIATPRHLKALFRRESVKDIGKVRGKSPIESDNSSPVSKLTP
jgi:hypothetical protein